MRMELRIHPDDVSRLSRVRRSFAPAETRARTRRVRLVFHDSPDRALAAAGLALIERTGHWRLERLVPGAEPWLPAEPPPVLEEAVTRDLLETPLPADLAPVVLFVGQEVVHRVASDTGNVTLTLLTGAARLAEGDPAAEPVPLAHLMIEGPELAVRALALHLAATLRVQAPRRSLPAEALTRLLELSLPPKRSGAPVLPADALSPHGLTPGAAFRHILGHLLDVILDLTPAALTGSTGTEPVHQMRVAVRRARSAITVFRAAIESPALQRAAEDLKTLGARLGPTRDWDVFVTETLPRVTAALPQERRLVRLAEAAQKTRQGHQLMLALYLAGVDFRLLGVELAWLAAAEEWLPLPPDPPVALTDFAANVLHRRWRKLTRAGRSIEALDIEALHDLRLRAKRARYTAEAFVSLYPGRRSARFIRRLSRLQQHLGLLNDGEVAAGLLKHLDGGGGRHAFATGLVLGYTAARAANVRPDILRAWQKFRDVGRFWG